MSQNFEETQSVNNENISVITTDTAPLVILTGSGAPVVEKAKSAINTKAQEIIQRVRRW